MPRLLSDSRGCSLLTERKKKTKLVKNQEFEKAVENIKVKLGE